MGNDRKVFGGFVGAVIMTSVNLMVSFTQLRLLLRHLPLPEAGIWIVYLNVGLYVLLLDMGLSPTLGREISLLSGAIQLTPERRTQSIGSLVRSCTIVVCCLAIIVYVIGLTAGWAYLHTLVPVALQHSARIAWSIFLAGAAINLIGEGWYAGMYGLGHVFLERTLRASGLLLGLTYMFIVIVARCGLVGLAVAYLLQGVSTVALARFGFLWVGKAESSAGSVDMRAIRRLLGPSFKYAATLLGGVLILQTDNLVIASCLGPAKVPDYQAVSKIVAALMTLSMMLIVSSQPFISRAYASHQLSEVLRLLNRNLRYTLSVMVFLGSFVACFADRIINLWIGRGHFVGFDVVLVLLLVMLLEAHHSTMAAATMAAAKIVFFVPALLAGALNLILSVALARHFGLVGVACGTLGAQVLTNNWYCPWYTLRLFHVPFTQHLRNVISPTVIYLCLMLGVNLCLRHWTYMLSLQTSLGVAGLASAVIGGGYFFKVMLSATERHFLVTTLDARRLASLYSANKIGAVR